MRLFRFKKIYILFAALVFFLLPMPLSFGFSNGAAAPFVYSNNTAPDFVKNNKRTVKVSRLNISSMYDSLRLGIMGLSQQAFQYAVQGASHLYAAGKLTNDKIISVIDFSKPSCKKRLFVIDIEKGRVLYNTYVAHGINSGKEYAGQFSNLPESNKSSLGFYKTAGTYFGKNGYSLHLEGLEKGINDNACRRDIVMHGAAYVHESYIQMQGYIGRSQGCPAVPEKMNRVIIDRIKNGTCLFIYNPNRNYQRRSRILKAAALQQM